MAKFTGRDFADQSFFDAMDKTLQGFIKISKEAKIVSKAMQDAKGFKAYTEAAKKATAATNDVAKAEARVTKATKELAFQQSKAGKELAKTREETRRATAENKKYAQSQLTAVKSTNRWGVAIKSFAFKFNALGNLIATGAAFLARQFVQAVRKSVDIIKGFDKSTARLASVVGKTREEIADLTKQSKLLGATTQFTATQVSTLQIELAKLGFTANEIKAATPGILSFATATGADLAAAAKTAGGAVRVFGLNALETKDAVATLAVATAKSGLTFEHYDSILSTVGPVAKAYGFELADIIALTGELASKNFEASKAATATKNILLNLADANGALAKKLGGAATTFDGLIDGLIEAQAAGIDLGEALELTDQRSVAAFSTFLEGAESARELRNGIVDVNDELDEMVEKQLDTLAGDIDLLRSAWEGFIISLGAEAGLLRGIVQFLTNATIQVSNLTLAFKRFHKQSDEQLAKSFDTLEALTNRQGDHFTRMIEYFDELIEANNGIIDVDQLVRDMATIQSVSKKGAEALVAEYLKRREETAEKDLEISTATEERKAQQAIDREKKKAAAIERLKAEEAERLNKIEVRNEKERTDAIAKARKLLNDAYAESKRLISQIKPPDDLMVSTFDIATQAFGLEDIEEDINNLGFLNEEMDKIIMDSNDMMTEHLIENTKKRFDFEDQRAQESADTKDELAINRLEAINAIAQEGFDIFASFQQREINEINRKLDAGIGNEKKLLAERAKLLRKQAIAEKGAALFSIGINTAVAITKALVTPSLIPFIVALGLAQAAAVVAAPIPQFAKGTKSSPKGKAIVGEKGHELMIHNGHVGLSPGVATLTDLKQGTEIIPADITNQILKYTAVANGFEGKADDGMIMMMAEKLDRLEQAIKSKPVSSSTITPAGILTATHRGNTTIKKLDKYFK